MTPEINVKGRFTAEIDGHERDLVVVSAEVTVEIPNRKYSGDFRRVTQKIPVGIFKIDLEDGDELGRD